MLKKRIVIETKKIKFFTTKYLNDFSIEKECLFSNISLSKKMEEIKNMGIDNRVKP